MLVVVLLSFCVAAAGSSGTISVSSGASEGGEAGAMNVMAHSGGAVDIAAGKSSAAVSYQLRAGAVPRLVVRLRYEQAAQTLVKAARCGWRVVAAPVLPVASGHFSSDTSSQSGSVTIGTVLVVRHRREACPGYRHIECRECWWHCSVLLW